MRYPDTNIMTRLFHLFHVLGFEKGKQLIPYHFSCDEAFKLYNGQRHKVGDVKVHSTDPDKVDPFHFGKPNGGDVGEDWIYAGYGQLYEDAIKPFADALLADLKPGAYPPEAGWRRLMRFDQYSTGGYMTQCMKYDGTAINWIETMALSSASLLSNGLAEIVLDELSFGGADPTKVEWWCIE